MERTLTRRQFVVGTAAAAVAAGSIIPAVAHAAKDDPKPLDTSKVRWLVLG